MIGTFALRCEGKLNHLTGLARSVAACYATAAHALLEIVGLQEIALAEQMGPSPPMARPRFRCECLTLHFAPVPHALP
jgi:hypothetical protein